MLISKQIFRNIPRKLSLSPHLQGLTAQSYRLDGLSRNEFLYYSQIFRFSKQKEDPEPIIEDEPNYNKDIKNEEDLFNSAVFKQKTFLEKHKLTFILLGGSAVCYTFGFGLLGTAFVLGSFGNVWKQERLTLRLVQLYEENWGTHKQKYKNLDRIIVNNMLQDPAINKFIKMDTICFTDHYMERRSHGERVKGMYKNEETYEYMLKKYRYACKFFDITNGLMGRAVSECIYNHDRDYYFRMLAVEIVEPIQVKKTLIDENIVDIQ